MGRHSKPSRIRVPQGASAAAAPTLASVALCLSPQAGLSTQAGLPGLASPTAVAGAAPGRVTGAEPAHPAVLAAALQLATAARQRTYRVRRGNSLTSIAEHFYHDRYDWTAIYWRNRRQIRYADDIEVGQELRIPPKPARPPRAPETLRPPSRHHHGRHRKPEHHHHHHHHRAPEHNDGYYGGPVPGGAFGRCVVMRESSRRPQVWGPGHHYGLYQFSEPTWIAYGGKRSEFGHATVREQNRVFATALARHGKDNWSPYDHC